MGYSPEYTHPEVASLVSRTLYLDVDVLKEFKIADWCKSGKRMVFWLQGGAHLGWQTQNFKL